MSFKQPCYQLLPLLILLTLACTTVLGQADSTVEKQSKNEIRINLGVGHTRLIDEGFTDSRMVFTNTTARYSVGYQRQIKKNTFDFNLEASVGNIKSLSGDLPANYLFVEPSLSFWRAVHEVDARTFSIGVSLRSLNVLIENQPVFDNFCITSLHGLYVPLQEHIQLNEKHSVHVTCLLPTVVYVNRVIWNGGASTLTFDDQDHVLRTLANRGSFTYFDLLDNIQFSTAYGLKIGHRTYFNLTYTFRFLDTDVQEPFRAYSNDLLTGLTFKF